MPFTGGITTGPILLERAGDSGTYTASGAAITVAGRVREAAPPGEILLAHDTFTQVRGVFTVHPHEPLRLRGRKEPLEVYVVSAAKERAFRARARGIEGVETKMVGREIELRLLQEAMTLTMEDGETQVVTVVGEAGVGKSRLLFEFSNWSELLEEDFWLFEARATQPSMIQPYSLTRDLFSFRFQILDSDALEVVHAKFVAGVEGFLGAGSAPDARHLGQLVGFDFSADPGVAAALLDAEAFRRRGIELLGAFFAAACGTWPAVLYIEDLHWADDSSLDLLNLLVRDNLKLPLFVLCMARPSLYERRPQWGEGQTFHEKILLEPLSHLSSRRLLRELLKKVEDVPAGLRDLVVERADGNPFYIEELVRVLIDDGVVVKGEPGWTIDESRLSALRIPPTLTGVLQSRLDTLPTGLQQLLQRSSVVGRVFWDAAAIRLGESAGLAPDEVQAMLEDLRRREMILRREESSFAGTVEYVFRHAILRDVTYETLVPRQRRGLHKLVGDWLLEMGGERAREHTTLVAEHYERAGESLLAAEQLLRTGQAAGRVSAHDEALASLERARVLATANPESAVHLEIEVAVGEILSRRGEREQARSVLEAVLPAARKSANRVLLAHMLGLLVRNAQWDDDLPAAQRYLDEALPLARELGDEASLMFVLRQAGNLVIHDRARALPHLEESLALARKLGDARGEAAALNSMGNTHQYSDDFEEAHTLYVRAASVVRGVDPFLEEMANENMGSNLVVWGRFDEAAIALQSALQITRQHRLTFDEASVLENLGMLELRRGNLAAAEENLRTAIGLYGQHGRPGAMIVFLFGILAVKLGDRDRGFRTIGFALAQPAGQIEVIPRVLRVFLPEIRGEESDDALEARMAGGRSMDFDTVLGEIAGTSA